MKAIDRWNAADDARRWTDPATLLADFLAATPAPENPSDRCSCGHTRAGHAGAAQPHANGAVSGWLWAETACSLMCCSCELFRSETDR